ncbi:hypothetical protein ABO04_07765 [Nitrosomonas sp. HPC101]|nr:hypothetical protein [Nitrosomonas sp. HPC101]
MVSSNNSDILPQKYLDDYLSENNYIFDSLDEIKLENFSRIRVGDIFCDPDCRFKTEEGVPLYFDRYHLTKTGSELLYPLVFNEIANLSLKK